MSIVPHRPDIPTHYCFNLHAGLYIKFDELNPDNFIIGPCIVNPLGFKLSDTNDLFNHQDLRNLRNINIQNKELIGRCSQCDLLESTGEHCLNKSGFNNKYIDKTLFYNQTGPQFITFQVESTCNLACLMCGPDLSTKWRLEEGIKSNIRINEQKLRELIRNINLENLHTVHILGGELLLSAMNKVILEELQPYSKNVNLWYDTNGTIQTKSEISDLWRQFKSVNLKFSIDGIGEAFNYLRWPADWEKVKDNMFWFRETMEENYCLSLRPSIGMLNTHCMNDLKWWAIKNFQIDKFKKPISFEYNPVYNTFSGFNMNQEMINDAREMYKNNKRMLALIPTVAVPDAEQKMTTAVERILTLDKKRGLDYRKSLPHLVKYFEKYLPK
jgi:hypothetical protein